MKKIYFILLCLVAFSTQGSTQTNKDQWMLGSTIGLTSTGDLDLGGSASDNHTGVIVNTTITWMESTPTSSMHITGSALGSIFSCK